MRTATLLSLAALIAVLPLAAEEKGSDTKGKFYFKKTCKTCHTKGGSALELSPLSKTQAQWKKFFDGAKHGKAGEAISPKLGTPAQVLDIKTFLINHASDSPQPETCGG